MIGRESHGSSRTWARTYAIRLKVSFLVGSKLYCARLRSGVRRSEAAQKIGIQESELKAIERGSHKLAVRDLVILARFYGLSSKEIESFTTEVLCSAHIPMKISQIGLMVIHRICVRFDLSNPWCSRGN